MKTLSIRQPWAFAILSLGKDVENRTWTTPYRGPVLLHASATYDGDGEKTLFGMGFEVPGFDRDSVERGGVVGVAELVACLPALRPEALSLGPVDPLAARVAASPWYQGGAAWVLTRASVLPFAPCAGALGLFDLETDRFPRETRDALQDWLDARDKRTTAPKEVPCDRPTT